MFKNRNEAGEKLAEHLGEYKDEKDAIILGLARGGVPVAHVVAQELNLPLDVVVVQKIGMPTSPETSIGAIAATGETILDKKLIESYEIEQDYVDQEIAKEKQEALRRLNLYRTGKKPLDLHDKTVFLIDDGAATGATMQAAIASVRGQGAKKIIVVLPVAPSDFLEKITPDVDKVICLEIPAEFLAVTQLYTNFPQVSDSEVTQLLQ